MRYEFVVFDTFLKAKEFYFIHKVNQGPPTLRRVQPSNKACHFGHFNALLCAKMLSVIKMLTNAHP